MCGCIVALAAFISPRLGIFFLWLFTDRMSIAFDSFWWGFLGFLFLPWTTIMYVLVFPGGIEGLDWLWLGLGLFADIASYGGSAWGNRDQSAPPPTWTTYDGV